MTKKNLEIIKGDSQTYTLYFIKDSGAISISGWKVVFIIKKTSTSTIEKIKKEITNHTNPEQGITTIPLSPEETNSLERGNYYYLIRVTTDEQAVFTILTGVFKVKVV